MHRSGTLCVVAAGLVAAVAVPRSPAAAQQTVEAVVGGSNGSDVFRSYCASCHGASARGDGPLAGELRYRSPGHLEMLVRQPKPESFFYQNGVLTIDGGGASGREISVDSQILLSTLFTALVGTLSGDESKLRGAFDLFFSDSDCAWRLTMIPKAERVRGKVEGVEISGTKERIEQIVFTLANGDRSVLTIRETE